MAVNAIGSKRIRSSWCTAAWLMATLLLNVRAGGVRATVSATEMTATPNRAAVGETIAVALPGISACPPLEVGAKTLVGWKKGPRYAFSWGEFSNSKERTATGAFDKEGRHRIVVATTVSGTAEYTHFDEYGCPQFDTAPVTGAASFQIYVEVRRPQPRLSDTVIRVSIPKLVSINRTGVPVSATVTRNGKPVVGAEVAFSSADVTCSPPTARTNAEGVAAVRASTGSKPSSFKNSSCITASARDGEGAAVWASDVFSIVEVNDPTPANPEIIVGHYSINDLYTVVLTYTVTPPMAGVPVKFCFESNEGEGWNYPATLEDQDRCTDDKGRASVRMRSGDLRESPTVKCVFQASAGATDVKICGITSVTCYSE